MCDHDRLTTPFHSHATATEVLDGADLAGRRAVVTGGASGIGTETVRALTAAGAEVTVATRDPASAEATVRALDALPGPGSVRSAPLDLADLGSVEAFARAWQGPLDILVANAGIMAVPERRVSDQGWELHLATNHLGHSPAGAGAVPSPATSVLLAASPLLEGVTGRYFEDNQEARLAEDSDPRPGGVAAHALDPRAADRLWEYAARTVAAARG
ncbi:SDR family NAD(P)-dependent oxidoreductase [Streptomyces sp. NPDC006978]|uniref:SDR family NAD(P)-dependent oxidoreductase n=1 Tax=unclassified Streptomyces TaxID=2593676 RepID=UPI002AFF170D|nr:SDR family NAD(P)-dependent oxidoreductase [Streptomyces sp. S584]